MLIFFNDIYALSQVLQINHFKLTVLNAIRLNNIQGSNLVGVRGRGGFKILCPTPSSSKSGGTAGS